MPLLPNDSHNIDVVELCGLLQCLGFHVKSIDTNDGNTSNDGMRTVVIDCQMSGLHVVLESGNSTCSCPTVASQQNSGVWQVSGVTGGKQATKEFGSTILGSLSKVHRERLTRELQEIVRYIKEYNDLDTDRQRDGATNRSASMIEIKTPEKRHMQLKADTPTRYRSLDTLTAAKPESQPDGIPAPGPLLKQTIGETTGNSITMCPRQSTYTLSSTPDNSRTSRGRNKTSSPIRRPSNSVLESLVAAEKTAEELRYNLSNVIKEIMEDGKYDSSSSLALDVSKISHLKLPETSKQQFASSPNLSGIGFQDDFAKRLKGVESASTSQLATKSSGQNGKTSLIRRISPNLFRKNATAPKLEKNPDNKGSKLKNSLLKPKIVTPVRINKSNTTDSSPNISGTRKKFGHIKSTIPRPTSKKE